MKNLRVKTKHYIKSILSMYSLYQIILNSVLVALAIFVIDYCDYPSQFITTLTLSVFIFWLVIIFIILGIYIIESHLIELFKIKSVNTLDYILLIGVLSSIEYLLFQTLAKIHALYKIILFLSVIIIFTCGIISRIFVQKLQMDSHRINNLFDLKDIYDNKIIVEPGMPILVQEKDVDYDLFKREHIINQLFRSISYVEPETSYVISLEGAWGSGKTTIINNVKTLLTNEYIIIDDFEPWLYGSQKALLYAMYDTLLLHLGVSYKSWKTRNSLNTICKIVADEHIVGNILYNITANYMEQAESISILKKRISTLIEANEKKIIFFIDNLDRANDNNIIFLFKLISLVFDLPRIVYVLSFEKERIDKVLMSTQEFNSRFTEKIIQQEITMHPVENEQLRIVYTKCIVNLLTAYNVPLGKIADYDCIINLILDQTSNLRTFKRIINSVFSQVFCCHESLYKVDLLAIELIRFFNTELYYEIQNNKKYFISYERNKIENIQTGFNLKDFNARGSAFFSNLLETNVGYVEILQMLFPNVARFINKEELISQHFIDANGRSDSVQNSRICNGQCFDLYFSFSSNQYLQISKEITNLVTQINSAPNFKAVDTLVTQMLIQASYDNQKNWVNRFYNFTNRILPSKRIDVIETLMTRVKILDDTYEFLEDSAYELAVFIIRDLILLCPNSEIDLLLIRIKYLYQALSTLELLIDRLEKKFQNKTNKTDYAITKLSDLYKQMCEDIISNNINIFNVEYYFRSNSRALYRYYKNNVTLFQKYINALISKENIYKILADILDESVGESYNYILKKVNFDNYILTSSVIDLLMEEVSPYTDTERFIHSIYLSFKNRNIEEESFVEASRDEPLKWDV